MTTALKLSATQRRRLRDLIPPQRCSATSKQTGGPCQRYAIPGASVCRHHGGAAPQTRALADRKVALSLALAEGGPGRSASAILIDALHTLDLVAANAKHGAIADPVSPALAAELIAATRDAASLAKVLIELGIDAPGVQRQQADGMTFALTVAAADLGLSLSESRVAKAVGAALRALDAAGPDIRERATAVERVVGRLKADREAREAAERDRAAAEAAELRSKDRAAYLIELKRAARQGRPCDVCGIAQPAVKAIASGPSVAQDPSVGVGGSPVTPSPSDGPGAVLTGELLPADPRRHGAAVPAVVVCPGCRGDRSAPGHDQQCGYATASTDPGRGRPWLS